MNALRVEAGHGRPLRAGDHQHYGRGGEIALGDAIEDVESVDVRHEEIEQHYRVLLLAQQADGLRAAGGDVHGEVVPGENGTEDVADRRIVIDYEDALLPQRHAKNSLSLAANRRECARERRARSSSS